MLKEKFIKLGSPKLISLKNLLANDKFTMGAPKGIKHLLVDIVTYTKQNHIQLILAASPIINIMKMIKAKLIDGTSDFRI